MQLARDAESDDPLRDVGSLQNNFLDCRRSNPAARGVGGRDSRLAATDHRRNTNFIGASIIVEWTSGTVGPDHLLRFCCAWDNLRVFSKL